MVSQTLSKKNLMSFLYDVSSHFGEVQSLKKALNAALEVIRNTP